MNIQDLANQVNRRIQAKHGDVIANYKLTYGIAQLFDIIKEIVAAGEDVTIKDFGRFTSFETKERVIENEITKKYNPEGKVVVEAHKAPRFRPAPAFDSLLRYGKDEVESTKIG